jgi:UDP-glucose 4-epimerase
VLLVVGKNSFIAKEFLLRSRCIEYRAIGHLDADNPDFYRDVTCVVNFSFSPYLYQKRYIENHDIDLRIARHCVNLGIHYVMLSSRKVYQSEIQWDAHEDLSITGSGTYGTNKLSIESKLRTLIPDKLTILRPGNILGYELERARTSFGSFLLHQLAVTGNIRLTISPLVRRNILSVESFCQILEAVVVKRPVGIFNVGSSEPVEVGKVASWMLEGFGSGDLSTSGSQIVDEFNLNVDRLTSVIGLKYDSVELENYAQALGRRLKMDANR